MLSTDTGVKLSYAKPTTGTNNKLKNEGGIEVASFADKRVQNNGAPANEEVANTVSYATSYDNDLWIVFNRDLAAAANLANSAFTVKKTPYGGSEKTVALSATVAPIILGGNNVLLKLAEQTLSSDTDIKVSYAKPTTGTNNKLKGTNGIEVASFTGKTVINVAQLEFDWAEVIGTKVYIDFTEDLAAAANLANSAFTVKKTPAGGTVETVDLSATVAPSISGKKVTLTLASAMLSTDTGVKVSYAKPTTGTNNKLKNAGGIEVASFTDKRVSYIPNYTPAPVSSAWVEIDGKSLGITFNESLAAAANLANSAFTVKKTPAGGSEKTVALSTTVAPRISGSNVTLTLAEQTLSSDTNIKVSYAKPTTGTNNKLKNVEGNEIASFTDLTVRNNSRLRFEWAEVRGTKVYIEFSQDLAAADNLANGSFTVKRTPSGGTEETVDLSGTVAPSISGRTVTLTLASAFALVSKDGSVKVSYTKPTTGTNNKLKNVGGDEAAGFTDERVRAASESYATTYGTSLYIVFSASLAVPENLANSAFVVKKTPADGTEKTVALSATVAPKIGFGDSLLLTLADPTITGDTNIKVSYTKPTAGTNNKLITKWGNEAASFTDLPVRNVSVLRFERAEVRGTKVYIEFSEALGGAANLANNSFTVKKAPSGGTEETVALSATVAPSISGKKVTLTLAEPTLIADTNVKVSYAKPTTGTNNKLKNEGGIEVASFTDKQVGNYSPATVSSATVDGTSLVITFDGRLYPPYSANLANSAFTVKRTPAGGIEETVDLSATVAPSINGRTVTLTLASAVLSTDTDVKVSYTKPTTGTYNKLRGTNGIDIASFDHSGVTNNSAPASQVVNGAPAFTSSATFNANENQTTVGTVVAEDSDSEDSVTGYAITGGADQAKFSITNAGALTFNTAPDYEDPKDAASASPEDAAGNNEYLVVVTATSGTDSRALTATQTITVTVQDANDPATGAPSISGSAQVGATLTAATTGIGDEDGLPDSSSYNYQWVRVDGFDESDISEADSVDYELVAADEGKMVKVRVSFTDGGGSAESRTSAESGTIAAAADSCVEAITADGSTAGRWADEDNCKSQAADRGNARYYTFTLTEQSDVTITLDTSASYIDGYLYLRSETAKSGTALHENDYVDDNGYLARISATLAAGSYTIEAATYYDESWPAIMRTGSFTLQVSGLK